MNTPAHHEIPMSWNESVLDVLAGFPHYDLDDVHQLEITPDGPLLILRP